MACCSSRKGGIDPGTPVWVHELVDQVKTGDLILTSNKDFGAKIIKAFTYTDWNHIGMIVKPTPTKAYLVEWGGGLFASELVERLFEYAEWDTVELVVRHIHFKNMSQRGRDCIEERMEKFIDMLFREQKGQNQVIPLGDVLKAARDQFSKWRGSASKDVVYEDNLDSLFCSKTVAVIYKAAGILAPNRKAGRFVPKHFSSDYDHFSDLQNGAFLGPEQRITFESRRLKDAVSNMLRLPILDVLAYGAHKKADEEKAALRIEKFVRKIAARRELSRRKAAKEAGQEEDPVLLAKGVEDHGTKDRLALLKQLAGMPHKKPADTLQLTWIDDEAATPRRKSGQEMLL